MTTRYIVDFLGDFVSRVTVELGTPFDDLPLSTSMQVLLDDDSTRTLSVSWVNNLIEGIPLYNPDKANRYVPTAFVDLPDDIDNNGGDKPTFEEIEEDGVIYYRFFGIAIVEAEIEEVTDTVEETQRITDDESPVLPSTITVFLRDGEFATVPVTWNAGDPPYAPGASGVFRFTGTLDLPEWIINNGAFKTRIVGPQA